DEILLADARSGIAIVAGEYGDHLFGLHVVIERHRHRWSRHSRRAAAHRVHDHQHGPLLLAEDSIDLVGRSRFLKTETRQFLAHRSNNSFIVNWSHESNLQREHDTQCGWFVLICSELTIAFRMLL